MATKDEIDAAYRIVRPDGSVRHVEGRGRVISRNADGSPKLLLSVLQDITDRVKREQHLHVTLSELNHRTKNLLSVVQSIARRTFDDDRLSKAATKAFSERLRGIAISHDLLVRGEWTGASLEDLVKAHIEPFGAVNTSYVRVSGPSLLLNPQAAQYFGLALHELATNSSKYGVLGSQKGSLSIEWALERDKDDEQVRMTWQETTVCKIVSAEKRGFGSMLLEQIVPRSVGGSSIYEIRPDGVIWSLYAPERSIVPAPL